MVHYFVEGFADDATGDMLFEPNIIMVISHDYGADVPVGTKVFLKTN